MNIIDVGIIFEKFSSLNASEQKVIDDAQKALERAKIELEDAQNKPDTWWNNLWGRKSKIKKAEQDLVEAEKIRAAADNKATFLRSSYDRRQGNQGRLEGRASSGEDGTDRGSR